MSIEQEGMLRAICIGDFRTFCARTAHRKAHIRMEVHVEKECPTVQPIIVRTSGGIQGRDFECLLIGLEIMKIICLLINTLLFKYFLNLYQTPETQPQLCVIFKHQNRPSNKSILSPSQPEPLFVIVYFHILQSSIFQIKIFNQRNGNFPNIFPTRANPPTHRRQGRISRLSPNTCL
jgi:hypothetical protein